MESESQKRDSGVPDKSKLAIASMILGIASYACLGPITSLPAVICGHISKSQIKESNEKLSGIRYATTGLILAYVNLVISFFAILAMLLAPFFANARETAKHIHCMNQIKDILVEVIMYSNDHNEQLPKNIDDHFWGLPMTCPSDLNTERKYQYHWKPGMAYTPDTILIVCPIHKINGHADGSVRTVKP